MLHFSMLPAGELAGSGIKRRKCKHCQVFDTSPGPQCLSEVHFYPATGLLDEWARQGDDIIHPFDITSTSGYGDVSCACKAASC